MIEIIWKATLLLSVVWLAQIALRRASAALRHFLWTGAFAAVLLLPVALRTVPKWRQPVAVAATVPSVTFVTAHRGAPAPKPVAWPLWLWSLGCAVAATRFLTGAGRTSWMVRHAGEASSAAAMAAELRRQLGISRKVRVLQSAAVPMPMTWGMARPVVLLPEDTAAWPEGRLHTVLLHELIHVRRWDLAAQALAQAACCLYWFHPLAWLGLRQQRQERERACDDAVLLAGVAPHDYAGHLVDLVRNLAARRSRWADAPAMAEAAGLEGRVRDLLRRNCNRRPLSRGTAFGATAAMAAILLPVAAFTTLAQSPTPGISGTVKDPSGAVIPNCRVVATNADGSNEETTVADAAGNYHFNSIPGGQYTLEFTSRGFKRFTVNTVLVNGAAAQVNANLTVGDVAEVVTVQGHGPRPTVAPAAGTPQRIKVGGMVQMVQLVSQVPPEYPAELQQAGVAGVVKIRAIIGKDGSVLQPRVINTVDSRLAQAALAAVSQWRYQPALLNGEPIEVVTSIDVNFTL